jgi:hypothetical protein
MYIDDGRLWPGSRWSDEGGIPAQEEAQKSAENLKARYFLLQVKVYDAAAHTRTRVQLPTGKATIPIDE